MRPEDLVKYKKYRHPLFNIDLTFVEHDDNSSVFVIKNEKNNNIVINFQYEDILKLTEAREPIKKGQVTTSVELTQDEIIEQLKKEESN
jgi:hypothetical protein